jgi:hypothetical protein
MKRPIKIILLVLTTLVLLGLAIAGYIYFHDRSAETSARGFCDTIKVGSDVSLAVKRATDNGIQNDSAQQDHTDEHRFYFPGFMLDQGVCWVSADKDGRVLSSHSEMRYDIR